MRECDVCGCDCVGVLVLTIESECERVQVCLT